ncbi:hypothetical protein SHIRM173S_06705 [Streptomyces hirsutus]
MSHDGVGPRAVMRSVAFLTAGALAVPALAGCSSDDDPAGRPLAGGDIARADRARVADGGTLRWGVDTVPDTLNTFQADADATTTRIAQAVLPSMFRMDSRGRPVRNPDYLESAEVVETEPKQVVLYKLNQQPSGATAGRSAPPTSPPSGAPCPARTPPTGPPATPATTASRRSSAARAPWRSRSPSTGPTPTGSRCSHRCTRRTSWAPPTPSTTGPARS